MTTLIGLLGGSWHWLIALAGVVAALFASYFGGKKIGKVQEKAKADVTAAQKETQQAQKQVERQTEIIRVAKDVEQSNSNLTDDAARQRMRESTHYSKD